MLAPRVAALLRARGLGVSVTDTTAKGVPDLLVDAWGLCVVPLETDRDSKERVIAQQLAWGASWAGLDVQVVRSEEEALQALLRAYTRAAKGVVQRASAHRAAAPS